VIYHDAVAAKLEAIGGVLQAAIPGGFQIATKTVPLAEVERVWSNDDSARRTVFRVGV